MAVNFPNSPTNGQVVTVDGVNYSWNAAGSVWDLVTTATTTVAVTAPVVNTGTSTAAVLGIQSSPVFAGSVGVGVSPALNTAGNAIHVGADASGAAVARFTRGTTGHNATDGLIVGAWSSGENIIYTYEAEPILFATSNAERMRITPSGQVSIGRTNPVAHQTLNVSAPDHAVISVEDIGNGMAYLAQAGNVTLLGAEAEFRIRNGTNYGSGPIASGTDRMTINTSGHVTTPFQPRFQMVRAYDGNGANWPNGTFFTYVHKPIDVGSNANTSTGRFTAPVAGYYQFGFMTAHKTAVPLGDMMFLKNGGGDEAATGVAVFNQTGNGTANEWITQTMTTVMYLATNDYVTVNNTCCWGGKPSEFRYIFNGYLLG